MNGYITVYMILFVSFFNVAFRTVDFHGGGNVPVTKVAGMVHVTDMK
jgi:hypothetical protein